MPIPDYQAFMLPFLEAIADGQDHVLRDVTRQLADRFNLSDEERQELLPSGQQTVVSNRVAWAKTYLKKAGLLENPSRGIARITQSGRDVLAQKPAKIDNAFLKTFPSFMEFYGKGSTDTPEPEDDDKETATPEELLETSYRRLRSALADELLERVRSCSPSFFERLVVQLLVAMG